MLARRYTIAGVEIFGGLHGVAITASAMTGDMSWIWRLVILLLIAFYGACFVAGMLLLRDKDLGASLSLYLQVPQLIFFFTSTLSFRVICGFMASIALTTPFDLNLNFQFGSTATLRVFTDLDHVTMGVNVIAGITLWQLYEYLEAKDAAKRPIPVPELGGMA